jgi:hypothetical protein
VNGTHKIDINFKPKISKEKEKFIFKKFEVDSLSKDGIDELRNYLKNILEIIFFNDNFYKLFKSLINKPKKIDLILNFIKNKKKQKIEYLKFNDLLNEFKLINEKKLKKILNYLKEIGELLYFENIK